MHNQKVHLSAAQSILQYLKKMPGKGILFRRNGSLKPKAYTEADYAGSAI